jgi:hypothetical protein
VLNTRVYQGLERVNKILSEMAGLCGHCEKMRVGQQLHVDENLDSCLTNRRFWKYKELL